MEIPTHIMAKLDPMVPGEARVVGGKEPAGKPGEGGLSRAECSGLGQCGIQFINLRLRLAKCTRRY